MIEIPIRGQFPYECFMCGSVAYLRDSHFFDPSPGARKFKELLDQTHDSKRGEVLFELEKAAPSVYAELMGRSPIRGRDLCKECLMPALRKDMEWKHA